MDDDCIRIVVGLRLGLDLCLPYECAQCGAKVDESGVHALSCQRSNGRLPRHSCLNDIIKHTLTAIDMSLVLWSPVAFAGRR